MKFQIQDTIENASLGFNNIPVRFFIYEQVGATGEWDMYETNESGFEEAEGFIEYERHSIAQNGCNQICLTKNQL